MTEDGTEDTVKQNELIISLLGRIAFKNDELKSLVTKGSKKPEQMMRAYNLCDGATSVTEIAKEADIVQSSLTEAVDKWERIGIILKKKKGREVMPLRLFEIE